MMDQHAVIAQPVKERVALALEERKQREIERVRVYIAKEYAVAFLDLAKDNLAFEITNDLANEEILELDRLVYQKIGLRAKLQSLSPPWVWLYGGPYTDTLIYLRARRKLLSLCGENFLPYDAVRQRAVLINQKIERRRR